MIRNIFDTENLPEDKNTVEKNDVSTEPVIAESSETAATIEIPLESVKSEVGTFDRPIISSGETEEQIIENIKESEFAVGSDSLRDIPEVSNESPGRLKNVIEEGENLLEFENEIAKIEEEVRLEKASRVENPENPLIEDAPARPEQTGIFAAALEKGQKEKKTHVPLEDLLIVPDGSEMSYDDSESANTGFILPNRTEPDVADQRFILPNRTESSSDDAPNIIDFKSESKSEIIRKSGMAWSAGIAFFASVAFLLIIGWFADLLLGTAPWGAVGGIIVGSIIGFVQLFRLTSQILKNSDQ